MDEQAVGDVHVRIGGGLASEPPVREVEGRGPGVGDEVHPTCRRQEPEPDEHGRDQDQRRQGKEPTDTPGEERPKGDHSRPLHLVDQETGDEEAGNDEEDVDPDVATTKPREATVVGHHQEDRDGT